VRGAGRGGVAGLLGWLARTTAGLATAAVAGVLWLCPTQAAWAAYNWAGLLERMAGRQDPEGMLFRATALLNLGRVVPALRTIDELGRLPYQSLAGPILARCSRLAEEQPTDPVARQCLAVTYYALNQLDSAVVHMQQAAALEPDNPWPLNLVAIARLSQNDLEGARTAAQKALAIDRTNQYAHLILSQVALKERNYLAFLVHYAQAPDAAREVLHYLRTKGQPQPEPAVPQPERDSAS